MVCDGTGSVSEVNGFCSSCLAATADDEEDEVTDDELDVDEDEVVRFFLPLLLLDEIGGRGFELMYSVTCWRYSWLIFNCC